MDALTSGLSIDVTQLPQVNLDNDVDIDAMYVFCRDRSILHPDWGMLAGRFQMYGIKRHAPRSFSESVREQKKRDLLDEDYYNFVMRNASQLDAMINHDADWKFGDFAMATLLHSYLFKVSVKTDRHDENGNAVWSKWYLETPQYMYMRVAVFVKYSNSACHTAMSDIKKMYLEQSEGLYTHASPTLFNAGRKRHQLSSCFLQSTSDTMESIEASWIASAEISRNSGGIGISYSSLRHSEIAQQGVSGGIVRWIKILTDILNAVDQGGLRKGSGAVYVEPWHIDVDAFLDLRKSAVAEDLRARDIYTALWIPDLFMKRVSDDGYWTLMCPNVALKDAGVDLTKVWGKEFEQAYERCEELELRSSKRIRARDLWQRILNAQIETGTPYMTFKDACNRKSNQQNLGTIKCSNLCVAGDTLILTDKGHIRIDTLKDEVVNVWNGEEFSKTTVVQTGVDKELLEVVCSSGMVLRCTPYHKFYITRGDEIGAHDLVVGDVIVPYTLPDGSVYEHVTIVSVTPVPGLHDTYCFNEPKRHMGVFNGVLTGQCSEIIQYSSEEEIASCNLASIALNACVLESKLRGGKYFSFPTLIKATASLVRNLNNVIDRNYYPDRVPTIRYANFRNRPIGIGIQGLADVFAMLDLTWDSAEAIRLNRDIAEAMYYGAVRESVELAKEFGRYETFQDSPASQGFFQFDLWDLEGEEKRTGMPVDRSTFLSRTDVFRTPLNPDYNWEALRSDMMEFGMRNSLLIANMPTASSASILGNNEAFEPFTQTNYARTTLSGQFVMTNKHMVADLEEINWWNTKVVVSMLNTQGSIQHIPLPSDGMTEDEISKLSNEEKEVLKLRDDRVVFLKKKYLNVFELSQKLLTDYNLVRGQFVCQSQSFNCWMKEPTATRLSAFHFYNWEHGAKTGMYYLRQTAKVDPINFALDDFNVPVGKHVIDVEALKKRKEDCVSCSS